MATNPMSEFIQHLRRVMAQRDGAGLTDGQLLEDYIRRQDKAALAALVQRHGPMVWGVCRRVLCNYHDAEDAFQATFLVLVRKATSIMPRDMVANWLYGVAHQTALKARAIAAKRCARERQVREMPEPAAAEQDPWRDLQPLLDQELSCLPDKYRAVIVLCDLEGKTRKEAALQLGVPEATVASRVATARRMLAKRLARHGLAVSGGTLAAMLTEKVASAGVPTSVVFSTINSITLVAVDQAAATGVISVKVAALTEGMLKTMLLTKLKAIMVLFMVAGLCSAGGLIYQMKAAEQPKAQEGSESSTASLTDSKRDKPKKDAADKKDHLPKTLEVRLRNVNSDAKQPVIGFDLDRYIGELDDRGLPRTRLPTAKNIAVLIDGKKAKLTDLLPGDKIALELSPDNKSIVKIHLTLKPRLDALEKEVDALRQRLKRLETGK